MGFYDKKSWQLRRKIKDLQSELRDAEKAGKFKVEEGLFFAELEQMGESTVLVMGTGDLHAAEERSVLISFYERNGFVVEMLKLEKDGAGVTDIQILPPIEFFKSIAKTLQSQGYRVVDDGDRVRPSDLAKKTISASSIIAASNALLATVVEKVIVHTDVKMNKEGNRLLNWMPKLRDAFMKKVSSEVVEVIRSPFEEAFEHFYRGAFEAGGRSNRPPRPTPEMENESTAPLPGDEASPSRLGANDSSNRDQVIREIVAEARKTLDDAVDRFTTNLSTNLRKRLDEITPVPPPRAPSAGGSLTHEESKRLTHSIELAQGVAKMYHFLLRADPSNAAENSRILLTQINRLLNATATCLMTRKEKGGPMGIFAQAGKELVWGESGAQGYPVSISVVRDCMNRRMLVSSNPMLSDPSASMMAYDIESTVAAPIMVDDQVAGILYADRREDPSPFNFDDGETIRQVVKVFEEFPKLTLGTR